jgi:ferrous iron transport protein A
VRRTQGAESKTTLNTIPYGKWATVVEVFVSGISSLRLMEMGLVPGAPVAVVRSAPLGDPLHVRLRDYHLALRRVEAESIGVEISEER